MVFRQSAYRHDSSNYYSLRIVHHRYHICKVYSQCGHGYVSSNYHSQRIMHHMFHTCRDYPNVDTKMCHRITII